MKTKSEKVLPKTAGQITNGGIYAQRVRCGKSNCRCARGEFHQTYYFFTRRNGKLMKFYIRKSELAEFFQIVKQAASARKWHRQIDKEATKIIRRLRQIERQRESLISNQ